MLLIAGCHRSGTSALAGTLCKLGAAAPAHLLPAGPVNPSGFWESPLIMEFNEDVLEALNRNWNNEFLIDEQEFDSGSVAPLKARLPALLEQEFEDQRLMLVKDPRVCLLLPLWLDVLDTEGIDTRVVIPVRHPFEVAQSLLKRDGIPVEVGMSLWLRHLLDAEYYSRGRKRAFVNYSMLLTDWRQTVEKINRECDLKLLTDSEEMQIEVEAFINPDLRHHHQPALDGRHVELHQWVLETYQILQSASEETNDQQELIGALDKLRGKLNIASRLFDAGARYYRDQARQNEKRSELLEQELLATKSLQETAGERRAVAEERLAVAEERLAVAEERLAEMSVLHRREIDELESRAANVRDMHLQEIAELKNRLEEESRKRTALTTQHRQEVSQLRRQLGVKNRELGELGSDLAHVLQSRSWRYTAFWRRLFRKKKHVPAAKRRRLREAEAIRASELFDGNWYLQQYPDVASAGADPAEHFLEFGWQEDRDPGPGFSVSEYLVRNPDVAMAGMNPLIHFLEHGQFEARFSGTVEAEQRPRASDPEELQLLLMDCEWKPLISVVVPVYKTDGGLLQQCVDSVRGQIYSNWELILVDDGSKQESLTQILHEFADTDSRIRIFSMEDNAGISTATNVGLHHAVGEYIAFLDHDDELTIDALAWVVLHLNQNKTAKVLYSDQDKIDATGRLLDEFFKPGWSPTYLQSVMYVGHLLVVSRELVLEVGGLDAEFDGVQDYELMLRLGERTSEIVHIPRVLYRWRSIEGSLAAAADAKAGIDQLQEKAVTRHLQRMGVPAMAQAQGGHRVKVLPGRQSEQPLVSILIPTKDQPELLGKCLQSLFDKSSYPNIEVILGDNNTTDPAARALFERYPVKVVPLPGRFHFAQFNNLMANNASGEYLVLLNNDVEIIESDWIEHLMLHASQPGVGAAGPLLCYPDMSVQHAGVILGPRGTADHVMRNFPVDADGYAGSLMAAREVSAVTAACLMVRAEIYAAVGGLNENFLRHYEDVDFCLRLRKKGLRNIYVGSTRLIHHESKSRGSVYNYTDRVLLLDYWHEEIQGGDPYYNPNFALSGNCYQSA